MKLNDPLFFFLVLFWVGVWDGGYGVQKHDVQKNRFIYKEHVHLYPIPLNLIQGRRGLVPNIGSEEEYTLDRLPLCHRAYVFCIGIFKDNRKNSNIRSPSTVITVMCLCFQLSTKQVGNCVKQKIMQIQVKCFNQSFY